MRFLHILLWLSTASLSIGCKDDIWNDSLAPQPHFGEATLARNQEIFDCIPYVKTSTWNDTTINLNLLHFKANTIPRGQLLISNFPPRVGKYPIKLGTGRTSDGPGALYGTYVDDGDFGGDIFTYDSTLQFSYIDIHFWDSTTLLIKGTFDIQLFRTVDYGSNPELPDTLNMSGSFYSKLDFN